MFVSNKATMKKQNTFKNSDQLMVKSAFITGLGLVAICIFVLMLFYLAINL